MAGADRANSAVRKVHDDIAETVRQAVDPDRGESLDCFRKLLQFRHRAFPFEDMRAIPEIILERALAQGVIKIVEYGQSDHQARLAQALY